jgi:hypothetical protein
MIIIKNSTGQVVRTINVAPGVDENNFISTLTLDINETAEINDYIWPTPIKQQIIDLEAMLTQRRIREALASNDFSFIQNVNNQIENLRKQL